MAAELVLRRRIAVGDRAFVDLVIWEVPTPVRGSSHTLKYRLAYIIRDVCVLRYDNEAGKGDHVHVGSREERYEFTTKKILLEDFWRSVDRYPG